MKMTFIPSTAPSRGAQDDKSGAIHGALWRCDGGMAPLGDNKPGMLDKMSCIHYF
jgi:hypothetical protein